MRKSKVAHLPSPTTLRAYTGKSTGEVGLTTLVEQRLRMEASRLSPLEKIGSLQVDETTIKQKKKYVRNLGRFVGRVDMGGIPRSPHDKNRLANKVLAFVFSGLNTRYKICIAIYLVNNLTAEQQKEITEYVIRRLEEIGYTVLRLVTDNLTTNVKMFKEMNGGVLHPVVPHPVQPTVISKSPMILRPLFLSFDPVHGIKNVRNQFRDRILMFREKKVSFELIEKIYHLDRKKIARAVRFLTQQHVTPNNLQRQRVKPALDVFRPEVKAAIVMHHENKEDGFEDVEGTVEFLEHIHKWFALHDISNTTECVRKRMPNKIPFTSPNDPGLLWLENDFLEYLKWNEELYQKADAIPKTKGSFEQRRAIQKQALTKETYEALRFTTVSTVSAVRYLLDLGFAFVLTRKFSSDDIEMFFGAVRQMMGGNFQGDAQNFITSWERILRTGIAYNSISSNVILHRETQKDYELVRAKTITKKRAKNELIFLPSSFLLVLNELLAAPGNNFC